MSKEPNLSDIKNLVVLDTVTYQGLVDKGIKNPLTLDKGLIILDVTEYKKLIEDNANMKSVLSSINVSISSATYWQRKNCLAFVKGLLAKLV